MQAGQRTVGLELALALAAGMTPAQQTPPAASSDSPAPPFGDASPAGQGIMVYPLRRNVRFFALKEEGRAERENPSKTDGHRRTRR